jgi:hypothetical protein
MQENAVFYKDFQPRIAFASFQLIKKALKHAKEEKIFTTILR